MFSSYTAIFDANVLYSARLRDLLLSLAGTGLFRARWTTMIHDEWIRALRAKGYDEAKLQRTRALIDLSVPDCLIDGFEPLIPTITLPDPDDRHVLAAAIKANADVIVTCNTRDFPESSLNDYHIEAQHPDDFIVHQIGLNASLAFDAIRAHRARLRNPPITQSEYLDSLESLLPLTVETIRAKRLDF